MKLGFLHAMNRAMVIARREQTENLVTLDNATP